jgi:uncharacterized surface protein with fasciclin (FAS1) repeats
MLSTHTRLACGCRTAGLAAMAAFALTATACSSATTSSTTSTANGTTGTAAGAPASPAASQSVAGTAATIGNDCGMIPASGMGSVHGMETDPVVTAASHNPLITTLAAEITKAHLTSTLNSESGITVFAPDNQAFKNLTAHDAAMMSGMTELEKILKYHVVQGRITPDELAHGMTLSTLEGSTLHTAKMGSTYEVNNAAITCGNLHTANATVYIINTVLMPAS